MRPLGFLCAATGTTRGNRPPSKDNALTAPFIAVVARLNYAGRTERT